MNEETIEIDHEAVKEYYGRVLQGTKDLKTEACCSTASFPSHLQPLVGNVHEEIHRRFYGCDSPIPDAIEGRTVLDLGCGTGRDVYLCSQLVGQSGHVIGVDMTEEQLEVARTHRDHHMERFGFSAPNVEFHLGYLEDLKSLGIEDETVDVVISNCVINLSPHKQQVFSEAFRVLKEGGEIYFSDVFADRRLPESWREDPVLLGECLAGAMYIEDFRRLLLSLGVPDYRIVRQRPIAVTDPEIEAKVGNALFYSMTVRAFKIGSLEDRCEDHGQVAVYHGSIPGHAHYYDLDDHHRFNTDKPMLVCGNTADMISQSRLGGHFEVIGDKSKHFGLFDCGSEPAPITPNEEPKLGGCC
ncbi:MAG: methyltransferase domain-containing protein [Candidatus Omnitrophica bacterium]|nr:methyltransferase domain-containing protein [Candidatus Omnitrophota bacterium]